MRSQRWHQSEVGLGLDRWNALSNRGFAIALAPGVAAMLAATIFSIFLGHPRSSGESEIVVTALRFLRIILVLCVPLSVLLPLYRFIIDHKRKVLLRVEQVELTIQPLRHWLFRPFQGIGIAFLFRAKLLAMLQFVGGPVTLIGPGRAHDVRQLVLMSSATVCASILLSTIWTMDDMGIRYANSRDQELKMVGKYVGTLMPVVFGIYGVIGLMSDYPLSRALLEVLRAVLTLYPPFACFAVLHAYFIRLRKGFVAGRTRLEKGGIWRDGQNAES